MSSEVSGFINKLIWENSMSDKLMEEAKDAFYKWEEGKDMGLSDNDRMIWMQGYVYAKQEESVDFDFTWDYRIVNAKSENNGEDWYCLKEVTYNNGKPTGYGNPCVGSEDADSFKNVWNMMEKAMQLPPLQEEDFEKGEGYTFEDLFNEGEESK